MEIMSREVSEMERDLPRFWQRLFSNEINAAGTRR